MGLAGLAGLAATAARVWWVLARNGPARTPTLILATATPLAALGFSAAAGLLRVMLVSLALRALARAWAPGASTSSLRRAGAPHRLTPAELTATMVVTFGAVTKHSTRWRGGSGTPLGG